MGSVGSSDEAHHVAEDAVWFGGASLVWWFCCPFWALVSFGALPFALVGLVRAWAEYRASRAGRASGRRALVGGGLSLPGATAAIAYLVFLARRPELPVQGQEPPAYAGLGRLGAWSAGVRGGRLDVVRREGVGLSEVGGLEGVGRRGRRGRGRAAGLPFRSGEQRGGIDGRALFRDRSPEWGPGVP